MGGGKVKSIELQDEQVREDSPEARAQLMKEKRLLSKQEDSEQLIYPIEQLAQDKLVIGNVKYPGADEDWPDDHMARFRFVTKMYPNAVGGPLYVDTPRNDLETHRAYERQRVIQAKNETLPKGKKIRHVVIKGETSYMDLLEQLGEN